MINIKNHFLAASCGTLAVGLTVVITFALGFPAHAIAGGAVSALTSVLVAMFNHKQCSTHQDDSTMKSNCHDRPNPS